MSSDYNGNYNGNFTWWNGTASTSDNIFFSGAATTTFTPNLHVTPDKDWMPYQYVEYEPKWHQKFASYKNQMDYMWN